ncbi:ABC transporter substrate-binding protein [Thalassobius sp. Cn5-15]|uniref:ABC transporter substrate-binding protein n=1 Tax=Thalassobius sp. Cn5-15 TaxID=2917763 RepID=UPI001EF3788F|nr:ABC transporter substrate-binding protein [Thalassobius sp. Cn5-15]MCG7494309.1 ABC transporter substrate-binding protein [Thalassobius sp. Cn5-15]
MKKTLITLSFAAALAMPALASADTLRIGFASAPRSIDPYPFGGTPTASLKEHVFEALVAADDSPLLAESWEWTSPTSLTVKLRQGISFHDGGALTARDVVYSACRMMNLIDGKRNLLTSSMGPVADVVAVDDHTVRFDMKAPYPLWVQKMKFLSILPASGADTPAGAISYDDQGDCGITRYPTRAEFEAGDAAIGTGPYTFVRFDKSGEADLAKNPAYWGEAAEWDNVEIRTIGNAGARLAGLLAGDFDIIENPTTEDLPGLKANPDLTYTAIPSWRSIFMVLDVNPEGAPGVTAADGSAPLADLRVRQAMSMAINRQAIADRLFGGEATAANQFAPSYRAGAPEMPALEYDPAKAKALLAEAGYADGFEINFFAPSDRYANGSRVAQAVTQYLSRVGITVNLKTEPWSVFAGKRRDRELGAFLYGWGHPQGAAQMISFAFASRDKSLGLGASNYSNYQNDAFDAAMQAWAVETDDAKANAHLGDAMRVAVADLPGIPLYYQHSIWAHRADLVVDGRQDERTSATTVSRK